MNNRMGGPTNTMNNRPGGPSKYSSQIFICESCDMQFSNRKTFDKHRKQENHHGSEVRSKGHTTNNQKSGIYVRGYPATTKENDLVKYFSQFGHVIWAHFGHDFLLLDFTEPEAVEKVMAKNAHFLHGQRLVVRHKEFKNNKIQLNDEEVDERTYQQIIASLKNMPNFDEEFLCLAQILQPNVRESFTKYNFICQDLYNFLSSRFPYIQVHPFGSTLTGLGFNNSDIDVFLSNVKETEDAEIECLHIVKRLLNNSKRFGNCFVIPGAKIPIVKCVHSSTGIKCDINIKNMLGVCNSKLIHYFVSIDMKIRQTIIVLKYWGKCHKITGQNHLLTNYSLVMLFIFFLQQPPYNFPTVLSLQQPEDDMFLNIQDCWNGGFIPNYNFHSDKLTSTPLVDILQQFFAFYSEFPYHTEIISPYIGKAVPRDYFNVPAELPDYYKRYKEHMALEANARYPLRVDTCCCLQDPFEHCRNITGIITDSVLEKFVLLCKLGQKICSDRQQVIYKLFTEEPPSLKKPQFNYKDDVLEISIYQGSNFKHANNSKSSDKKSKNDQWFETLVNFITIVLRDFLQLNLTSLNEGDDSSPSKNSKNEGQADVHDSRKIIFSCAGKTNMWHARKATAKQLNLNHVNSTLMERESAITNHLKEVYKNFQDTTDILSFKIMIAHKNEEAFISVEKITAYKKSFKPFAMFFAANIPLWFEIYERDLSKGAVGSKK